MLFPKGTSGNPNGRPPTRVDPKDLAAITKMASRGVREKDIARSLSMSAVTWAKVKANDQAVADAFDKGRQLQHDQLVGKLYERAMKGDVTALIYALRVLHGYRENELPSESRAQVIINLPAPASVDSYPPAQIIEHDVQKMLEVKRG